MTITWQAEKSAPDPFATAVGDTIEYHVAYGNSDAVSESDIKTDLAEVIENALPFARSATGQRAANMMFLWDAVYCCLTIVCSDETMMEDSPHVTKCSIDSLEAKVYEIPMEDDAFLERELIVISETIRGMLKEILENFDANDLPSDMPIMFSCEERSSVPEEVFRNNTVRLM